MFRSSVVVLSVLALPACSEMTYGPQSPIEASAAQHAQDLLWTIESEDGGLISSATAFGPGRLLASASAMEVWIGHKIRARHGSTVVPVQDMRLAVRQNFAILHIQEPNIALPAAAETPREAERLAISAASAAGPFAGVGPVVHASRPVAGPRNVDELVLAELPAAGGFAGAPVVDVAGRLVGIADTVLHLSSLDPAIPPRVDPGASIPRRTMTILPMTLVRATIQAEGLDQPPR